MDSYEIIMVYIGVVDVYFLVFVICNLVFRICIMLIFKVDWNYLCEREFYDNFVVCLYVIIWGVLYVIGSILRDIYSFFLFVWVLSFFDLVFDVGGIE